MTDNYVVFEGAGLKFIQENTDAHFRSDMLYAGKCSSLPGADVFMGYNSDKLDVYITFRGGAVGDKYKTYRVSLLSVAECAINTVANDLGLIMVDGQFAKSPVNSIDQPGVEVKSISLVGGNDIRYSKDTSCKFYELELRGETFKVLIAALTVEDAISHYAAQKYGIKGIYRYKSDPNSGNVEDVAVLMEKFGITAIRTTNYKMAMYRSNAGLTRIMLKGS